MDIIQLLPDSIANQIAAGEVIQRPASAVKELLENAIDAGSTEIKLIVKDAGRTLVQVIDNGCGMSETDARMSFERHATSKIRSADDLFAIRTMGFRGEALASIAAISQVELKTRRTGDELGSLLEIEASEVICQEPCQCSEGTSISMKNVFFNVPARRNFLKSNTVEFNHIITEFERVSIANPGIGFSLHHNNEQIFKLNQGNLRQRLVGLYGSTYNERLVPVGEVSSIININGFVVKPEHAKKTRGEQYFFVNKRFIKDSYLNHAIMGAYNELLPEGLHAGYFLFIDIDPSHIDINIHPTKTEIKFDDERSIYSIVKASVRKALGSNNVSPTLDFEQEVSFNLPFSKYLETPQAPTITVNLDYNPFKPADKPEKKDTSSYERTSQPSYSKPYTPPGKLINPYEDLNTQKEEVNAQQELPTQDNEPVVQSTTQRTFQLHNIYIATQVKSGLMLIDQQAAHERILYERYITAVAHNKPLSQQILFPQTIELSPADFELVKEIKDELHKLGLDVEEFGKNTVVINGIPTNTSDVNEKLLLEGLLENYKNNVSNLKTDIQHNITLSLARTASVKSGTSLNEIEMNNIIDELFACEIPHKSPSGKTIVHIITLDELSKKFNQ